MSKTVATPAASKAFTPPLFGNFGKKAKDLFKKKYDFENQARLVNVTAEDITIETSVVAAPDAGLRGVFKSTVPVRTLGAGNGVFDSEFHTVAEKETKASYRFNNLSKGLAVKATLVSVKPEVKGETPDFPEGWAALEAEYSADYFSGSVAARSNVQKTLVDVVAALGYDKVSVGAKATIDTASKVAPTDYNFGAELLGADYTATAVTEKKRTALTLSYFQAVNKNQVVGATATFGLVKPTRTLTFGTDYVVDPDTTARSYIKVDSTKEFASVGLAVEHKLANPQVQIGVATEYNITANTVAANKFGVTVSFGDF